MGLSLFFFFFSFIHMPFRHGPTKITHSWLGFWRRAKAKVPGVISAIASVRTKAWELISRRVYIWLSPLEGAAYGAITSSHQRRTTWPSLLPPPLCLSRLRIYGRVETCLDGQTNGQTKRLLRANRRGLPRPSPRRFAFPSRRSRAVEKRISRIAG